MVEPVVATEMAGLSIVMVTLSFEVHPPVVPVTVYVTVEPGLAVGFGQLVHVSPAAGNQLYVVAPLAVSDVLLPLQIVAEGGVTVNVGVGVTEIVTILLSLQPEPELPTTVYVVVDPGLAVTLEPVVELNPVVGLHT